MGIESKYIWMDGELVEYEKANIHFLTGALHYGAGVFEGIRAYQTDKGPAVFRLTEHVERLIESAEIFGFRDLPYTVESVTKAILETTRVNGFMECYIRPLIYFNAGTATLNLDDGKASLGIGYLRYPDAGGGFRYELYDVASDPSERVDLYPSERESAADLRALLDGYEARSDAQRAALGDPSRTGAPHAESVPLDPAQEEKLRALGYLE